MVEVDQYFDLWNLFVNELAGDLWIFVFVVIGIIMFITLRNRMPFQASIMLGSLFMLVVIAATDNTLMKVLVILIIGAYFYYELSSAKNRG